ncbi:uncharacterized protein LOC105195946 isoform X2 [Solenopsis invicta]|uniref:uncharacterized protein LOC105195946 isoform X2 n=1 Tax=Solenopsis invicta TaxID=13686 RepID=UPI000E33EE24|nr:uncharacterized protein LOC105195946 isoform X2 [Solenopsis invicta]
MLRIIAVLFLVSTFILTVQTDNVLKCYMCNSLSNESCGSDMTMSLLQAVECTDNKIRDWQRSIQQHNDLKSIVQLFAFDEISQHYSATPIACAKVILNIAKRDVVVRTCQKTKTHNDLCKKMKEKLKDDSSIKMEQCAICHRDACNNTMFLFPEIFYIFMSFFCSLITFYRWT